MLRSKHFTNLVEQAVTDGYKQGIQFFMENLENHLGQEEFFESCGGVENYYNNILKRGIEGNSEPVDLNEGVDEVSEEYIDQLVQKYSSNG